MGSQTLCDKQMKVLGIDYGRKKIGVALSENSLAEPYGVIKVKTLGQAIQKVEQVVQVEQVEEVVIGLSEGKMGEEAKKFGEELEKKLRIPVNFQDETLSTQEAQELSRKAGIKMKKRQKLEDAYSATLILQAHLDSK